jgi:glucan endo-1,3-alpha-glucosidase
MYAQSPVEVPSLILTKHAPPLLFTVPHTDILSLQAFYGAAWKNGAYPAITSDKVWVMARPHAASAPACCDSLGPPSGREWVGDGVICSDLDGVLISVHVPTADSRQLLRSSPPHGGRPSHPVNERRIADLPGSAGYQPIFIRNGEWLRYPRQGGEW